MQTIWKFPFEIKDDIEIEMPVGADILSVQTQGDKPCMWARGSDKMPTRNRKFQIFGTGQPMPIIAEERQFIGTFQLMQGQLVFHLFEILNN